MNEHQDVWVWAPWFNSPRRVDANFESVAKFADDNPEHFLFYAELVTT